MVPKSPIEQPARHQRVLIDERRQVCRHVHVKGETGLVASMGEKLFDLTGADIGWVQLPRNHPSLIAIRVNVMPCLYCSPIGLARN